MTMLKRIFVAISLMLISQASFSTLIVDTGTPSGSGSGSAWLLSDANWLAGEFSLTEDYVITDIFGYMYDTDGGSLTLAIYGDGGDIPDTANEIFSGTFNVAAGSQADWYGLSNLNLSLAAATYWVAFEVRATDDYSGGIAYTSPNPLNDHAFGTDEGYTNQNTVEANIGVQIYGDPDVHNVPEPSSLLLILLGLLSVIWMQKGKGSRHLVLS